MNLDDDSATEYAKDWCDNATASEHVYSEVEEHKLSSFSSTEEEEEGVNYNDHLVADINIDEEEEEKTYHLNEASFIMNQKSLSDKAPGSLQHSFAHRTIPHPDGFPMRLLQFSAVFVIAMLSTGVPFGSPVLVHLMLDEDVFKASCEATSANIIGSRGGCATQEAWLAILQVAAWTTWFTAGWLGARSVQRLGPRSTAMIGTGFLLAGSLTLALSLPADGAYLVPRWARAIIPSVVCMSVGSVMTFVACLHYVRLFPKRTSLLHSLVFLAQDLSGLVMYVFFGMHQFLSLRVMFFGYAIIMVCQLLVWTFLFAPIKIPTIRFTVTLWHQRPLLVDQRLVDHLASPYFGLALAYASVIFAKIFFYMSTFQIQLRILLMPTTYNIDPEDFMYHPNESGGSSSAGATLSYIPFFAEQPGGTSSSVLAQRQFTYNPMQPEIFLTDLQEMLYLLMPTAALVSVFWMRACMSDWKISSALLSANFGLFAWGIVQ